MPTLALNDFNLVCTIMGVFLCTWGLMSQLWTEILYLSDTLISLLVGLALGPLGWGIFRPLAYAGSETGLAACTLAFSRLALDIQLTLTGVQLPSRYLKLQSTPLLILLVPIMAIMWLISSTLIYALVPNLPYLQALAIGACVTPTDPVLSNSIVKGAFAEAHIPVEMQHLILAESGANDGLGYPFLFLALYLVKYNSSPLNDAAGGSGYALRLWFTETWLYTIILSIILGAVVGCLANLLLQLFSRKKLVGRESFLAFSISLALFVLGICGLLGTDDILACFIAGNTFTWDDWYRLETLTDGVQPVIDMLLNIAIFFWLGAVCPWESLVGNAIVPLSRLIPLGLLIMLLRRLPIIFIIQKYIPQIQSARHALFMGFFGPIGVSAIFYLYITLEYIKSITVQSQPRVDLAAFPDILTVVIWFLVLCSVIIHGLAVPVGKGFVFITSTIHQRIHSDV